MPVYKKGCEMTEDKTLIGLAKICFRLLLNLTFTQFVCKLKCVERAHAMTSQKLEFE